jgi:molybdopterin-containing oxidoreductase family membrane subunit
VIVISTYLAISLLLLYLPLVPDFAILRDHQQGIPNWQRNLYKVLALNWQNLPEQKQILQRSERILAILIIPGQSWSFLYPRCSFSKNLDLTGSL